MFCLMFCFGLFVLVIVFVVFVLFFYVVLVEQVSVCDYCIVVGLLVGILNCIVVQVGLVFILDLVFVEGCSVYVV